ncbi:MAG: epimerase [Deltaproteobacteria bacterium RIFCSPLOWO2_12_FULL_43_16]|nr:MAG: epimerase [Deltaproteobacteria bacterium GWA2_43_19]OGQ09718.1 MAG: epimerase [Deltaproteobacteria bacterium RIFCSPHIGHO2_02_FULL_43_33]OGQ60274.1 MAG: epimerase [Deltaproteobacteria bacterium RIFCSPLOWO2_12_FULL_43_16]HBR16047.1 epimerase [Deltaproteobacteria bacterium]
MNILVTGAAGFIGSNLTDKLLEKNEKVIAIDDFNDFYVPDIKEENLKEAIKNPNFKLYRGDIRDKALINKTFKENSIDVVCHIAARAGVRPSLQDPVLYEEVNCLGTLNLLEAVKKHPVQNFVFASSSSVYGINSKVPFLEDDPISQPISPYAATKRASELMAFTYSHLYKVPITNLRFFTVYGERGRPEMAVANFTRRIYEGKEIVVNGDGTAKRDFTYIGDILQGILASIYKPFPYEIINLGESRVVEVNYLISLIEKNVGKKAKSKYLPPAPGDVPITYADISKAKRLLGYEPKVQIEEGIERYVKWFLEKANR